VNDVSYAILMLVLVASFVTFFGLRAESRDVKRGRERENRKLDEHASMVRGISRVDVADLSPVEYKERGASL